MGWASGSALMDKIITAFEKHCDHVPFEYAVEFYKDIITAFEKADCDTLYECMEGDEDDCFDTAMKELHPEMDEDGDWDDENEEEDE